MNKGNLWTASLTSSISLLLPLSLQSQGVSQTTGANEVRISSALEQGPTLLATLQATDSRARNRSREFPQFSIRSFSPDGRKVFVSVQEVGGPVSENPLSGSYLYTSLVAVDLFTGSVSKLGKIQADMDWFPGASSLKSEARTYSNASKVKGGLPWLTLGIVSYEPPPVNVLTEFKPEGFQGKLVYASNVHVSGKGGQLQWQKFLTLRRVGSESSDNSVQTYPAQVRNGGLFAPQWSPDGKRVLLKVGDAGDRYNTYLIHLWTPETGQISQGPVERISFLFPRWSPDSQRIAYIVGGDTFGNIERDDHLLLRVYNLRTRQSRPLATSGTNFGTPVEFAWDGNSSLLFTGLTKAKHPSVYETSVAGVPSKLLIRDGQSAVPSPEGRLVAFFGWPEPAQAAEELKTDEQSQYYGARLHIFDRETRKRRLVSPNVFDNKTQVAWTPDGKRLVLLQSSYDSNSASGSAKVSIVAVSP